MTLLGYYKNEKANEEALDSEGWLRTGDIAYFDEDQDFYIVDRLKEFIKVKGFQVNIKCVCPCLKQSGGCDSFEFLRVRRAEVGGE